MKFDIVLIGVSFVLAFSQFAQSQVVHARPESLKVGENFVDPLGYYDANPEFSWKLPAGQGIQSQSAYRIVVTDQPTSAQSPSSQSSPSSPTLVWDSGKVESDQSVWVPYDGPPLTSRQTIIWRVKFWDEKGQESAWSEEATVEMGLLSNVNWAADWIEFPRESQAVDQVKILSAKYGYHDGASSIVANVSKNIERGLKNGRTAFPVTNERFGGDPAPGKQKQLWVDYEINGIEKHVEIDEKDTFEPFPPIVAHPGYVLRHDFESKGNIVKARLYASALGFYQFQINGQRVGKDVLAPGYTVYDKRVESRTYDVTPLIRDGQNTIGALLGEGWYAGNLLTRKRAELMSLNPKLLGQLELTYSDGRVQTVCTDDRWKSTDQGPMRSVGVYHGEDYDAAMELGDWDVPRYDDKTWAATMSTPVAAQPLVVPKPLPAVKVMKQLAALSVNEPQPGKFVFDFGQNLVGFPTVNIPVKPGQKVLLRFAEMLEEDATPYTVNYRTARSQATYAAATDGIVQWEPNLTFFGFRYLEISGLSDDVKLTTDAATANVIYTDFQSTGKFTSSHEKLNQLQSNIRWGQIGNFVDIPTDCPQRDERLGWTGDAQVFLPTSFFNYDVYSFWARWLQSVRDEQTPDGKIPHTVPATEFGYASPGWADVIVTAPWETYERTGDLQILAENYEAMKNWVGVYESNAEENITSLKGFGDWLQPYSQGDRKGDTPQELISTAYFGRDARILAWTAKALGKTDDAQRYETLHANIRTSFSNRYWSGEKIPAGADTQTACLMALGYDLVEPNLRENVAAKLLEQFESANRHLRTGFLGTPLLAPVFDDIGHPEICFELLFKESYPSWFYSIDQGATTMWERWNSYSHADGFGDASMNSFNHYAYGAIGQFMYERVAGLSPDPEHPGYKHFFIRPLIGGPLEWVSAELDTPYGIANSGWSIANGKLTINATVPPNSSATVVLPTDRIDEVLINGVAIVDSNWKLATKLNVAGQPTVDIGPGTYEFHVPQETGGTPQETDSDSQWRPLLGKTLDGWEVFTGVPHTSVSVPGAVKSTSKDGHSGTPVGLGDPLSIFKIEEIDGQPVLHISGQVYAGLTTLESFSNYHLSLQYKWGTKKWPPRLERKRDSGLLIHCHGEHGEFWNVWMSSLECQIQETDAGDFYALGNTSAIVPAVTPAIKKDQTAKSYDAEGQRLAVGKGARGSFCKRSVNHERPDQWNQIDVMAVGDKVRFIVNGHVVMELFDTKIGRQKDGQKLESGKIQIQSEAAEVFYRNIRIRPISEFPPPSDQ